MDLTDTIAPNSDQLDAVDLLTGPRTFTIARVSKGDAEQPVNIHLAEFDRPWRPGKSMRRVLVACWGADASAYVGRRVTLFCDPNVRFGGEAVGGTRISALSHLDKSRTIPLLVTRGRSAPYRVEPLTGDTPKPEPKPAGQPLTRRVADAVASFGHGGVTLEQLERRVGRARSEWTTEDVDGLQALFEALRGRQITKDEAFPAAGPEPDGWREPGPAPEGPATGQAAEIPVEEPTGWERETRA